MDLTNVPFIECSKKTCNKVFELKCLGIPTENFETYSQEYKDQWVCPECVCSQRKPSRNADTPVSRTSGPASTFSRSSNVNTQRGSRIKTAESPMTEQKPNLLEEIKDFRLEVMSRLDSQTSLMENMQEIFNCTKNELQELRLYVKVLEQKVDQVFSLEKQMKELSARNQYLEHQINISKKSQPSGETLKCPKEALNYSEAICKQPANDKRNKTAASPSAVTSSGAMKTVEIPMMGEVSPAEEQKLSTSEVEMNSKADSNEGWNLVRNNKRKFQSKEVKRGQNSSLKDIQAMERKKHLHVWRLHPETTVESLTTHVKQMCGSEVNVKIEKIKHKTERDYSSFIVGIAEGVYHKLCHPDVWPVNAEFSEWIWFRRSTNRPNDGK